MGIVAESESEDDFLEPELGDLKFRSQSRFKIPVDEDPQHCCHTHIQGTNSNVSSSPLPPLLTSSRRNSSSSHNNPQAVVLVSQNRYFFLIVATLVMVQLVRAAQR